MGSVKGKFNWDLAMAVFLILDAIRVIHTGDHPVCLAIDSIVGAWCAGDAFRKPVA